MNRYKDWLFPIDRFKREYTVRILFDRIKSPEMVLALDSVTAMFEIENSPSWYLRRSYLSGSRSTDIADSSKCTIQPEIRMSVELLKLYKIVVLGDSGVRERELTIQVSPSSLHFMSRLTDLAVSNTSSNPTTVHPRIHIENRWLSTIRNVC
jgi:hypothetical protein